LQPAFTLKFANSAGFDILETTVVNIQDLPLEAVLDDDGQKALFAQLPKIMQQVYYRITLLPCPWPSRRRHCKSETSPADLASPNLCEQGLAYLPGGVCRSSMGRQASYEQAVAWKVVGDDGAPQCLALMLVNWTFI
jgi:homeobox-leucine zipper protein